MRREGMGKKLQALLASKEMKGLSKVHKGAVIHRAADLVDG